MRRIGLAVVLALGVALAPLTDEAQQTAKVPRIGVLWPSTPSVSSRFSEAFKQGLRGIEASHRYPAAACSMTAPSPPVK